jgi:CBS domain-containing protein
MEGRRLKVSQLMHEEPVTILMTESIYAAALKIKERNVGTVIVVDKGHHIKGIVTDRDIALSVTDFNNLKKVHVSDIMNKNVKTIQANDDMTTALKIMNEEHVRRLPVKEKGKLVGILSSADLAIELKEELDQFMDLEDFFAISHKLRYRYIGEALSLYPTKLNSPQ